MLHSRGPPINSFRFLVFTLGLTLVSIVGAWLLIAAMVVDDRPTLEQMLSPDQAAEINAMRALFNRKSEPVLVAVSSEVALQAPQIKRLTQALAALSGVQEVYTWDAPPASPGGDAGGQGAYRQLILVWDQGKDVGLEASRRLHSEINHVVQRHLTPGQRAVLVGAPRLRSTSWEVVRTDARWILPLLIASSLVVVYGFFLSWTALGLSLAVTSSTTLFCLALQYCLGGHLNALMVSLVPVVWAIATLDVFHLYVAVAGESRRGTDNPIRAGTRQVIAPCLLTTTTTVGCFLALALGDDSPLVASFGVMAAVGTVIAFLLSFTLGPCLLSVVGGASELPRWPAMFSLGLVRLAERRHRLVVAFWLMVVVASMVALPRIQTGNDYPQVFAHDREIARDIEWFRALTGSDLNPVDLIIRSGEPGVPSSDRLFAAVMFTANYLRTIDETVAILPVDLLREDDLRRLGRSFDRNAMAPASLPSGVEYWYGDGAVRIQWYLAATDYERKRELFAWVRNFDEDALPRHHISLSGPGYYTHQIEQRGIRNLAIGFICSLGVVGGVLILATRDGGEALAGLAGTVLPLLFVGGCMVLLAIPWSVALLPVPAMLLGLANDDAIHMLWDRRRARRLRWRRTALQAGHALLATSVILAFATATMLMSGIETNRYIGMLTPLGLMLALLCNLTLLPAISSWRRR